LLIIYLAQPQGEANMSESDGQEKGKGCLFAIIFWKASSAFKYSITLKKHHSGSSSSNQREKNASVTILITLKLIQANYLFSSATRGCRYKQK
jgi:hypothetical protein